MPDTSNENQIRTLVENWAAAVRARNIEAAVAHHTDDVVMFDVPVPLQSRGLVEYQKTWEVFDYSFSQVADALGRNEAACRQLASRARTRVRGARPKGTVPPHGASSSIDPKHAELVSAFITASRSGDIATLTRLLSGDARLVTDGGGKVPAALNAIDGADHVAAFLAGVVRKGWTDEISVRFETINGLPGLIVSRPSGLVQTNAFEIENGLVKTIYVVRNPDKLRHLPWS